MTPRVVRGTFSRLVGMLRARSPRGDWIFLSGAAPDEGNILELVRHLLDEYDGRLYWARGPAPHHLEALGIRSDRVVVLESHASLSALYRYARAEVVFTTHGAYGMPTPDDRKPVIDLWHGEASKGGGLLYPDRTDASRTSSALLASARALAPVKAGLALMPLERTVHAPPPRVDQFRRPTSDDQLHAVGIDPDRPFVVWMPTFRQAGPAVVNTTDVEGDRSMATTFSRDVVSVLDAAGIGVVVKPHPADSVSRQVEDAVIVTSEDLYRASIPLYSLLGRSAGLVTDYSSVWIDYLHRGAPIGFYLPDLASFVEGRGDFSPGLLDHLPGPVLDSRETVDRFARDVLAPDDVVGPQQASAREFIDLVDDVTPSAAALVEALRTAGLFPASRLQGAGA